MIPPQQRRSRRSTRSNSAASGAVQSGPALRSRGRLTEAVTAAQYSGGNGGLTAAKVSTRSQAAARGVDSTPAAAGGTLAAAPRLTRSNSTQADLAPPLQGSSSKRALQSSSSSNGSTSKHGNSSKRVTCSICLEDVTMDRMHKMGSCRHRFCKSCLATCFKSAMKAKNLPATCPHPGCKGGVSVRDATVVLAGSPRLASQFIQANKDATALAKGLAIYCPTSSCSKVMHIQQLSAAAARKMTPDQRQKAKRNMSRGTCSRCNKTCCTSCRVPWHAGLSCAQYEALPAAEKGEAEMALWELSDNKQWKRCPSCRSLVERIDGCNYMMCRCKQAFCYRCGSKIEVCYSTGCLTGRPWV